MTITQNKYVTVAYSFSTPDGYLLGTSERQGPLVYCSGSGDILSGLDKNLSGHAVGEQLAFVLAPEEAYGQRDETLVSEVTVKDLGLDVEPKIGYQVEAQIGGRWRVALIADVKDDKVTLDANHPLAGVPLHFQCTILSIDDEAPVMEGCGCGGSCGSGGGCESDSCGTDGSGCGGCGCGGH